MAFVHVGHFASLTTVHKTRLKGNAMMAKKKKIPVAQTSPVPIESIVFGLRYEPKYAIMDQVGSVIDAVLREEYTPFGPKTFPLCQSSSMEHKLYNTDTHDSLRITQSDTILQLGIASRDFSRINARADDFDKFIIEPLKEDCRLNHIERFGFVCRLAECGADMKTQPIVHYLQQDFPSARNLTMRFTRRLPSTDAVVKKAVGDYRNAIYTLEQDEEGNVRVSIDYQEYFKPSLDSDDWKKKSFPDFISRGLEYFDGEFGRWFNKLHSDSEVA